jgi:hypothetical protein
MSFYYYIVIIKVINLSWDNFVKNLFKNNSRMVYYLFKLLMVVL